MEKRTPFNKHPKLAQPGKQTIAAIIEHACTLKGANIFVKDDQQELTGAEFWQSINAVAANLSSMGLNKGDTVAFLCKSSVSHAIAMSACLVSGIVSCCLHTRETRVRNKTNVDILQAKVIFADFDLIGGAQEIAGSGTAPAIINLSHLAIAAATEDSFRPFELPSLTNGDAALILLSSGTTGRPKFVLHSQGTLAATAQFGPYNYDCWSSSGSTIVVMNPSFAAWIHTVLPFIAIQGRILFGGIFDAALFLKTIEQEKLTLAPLVPTAWRMVLAAEPEKYDLTQLKTAFFSGEPGSESLVQSLKQNICPNVMTSYLAAEGGCASGIVAGSDILSVPGQAASTGRPVPNGHLKIVDPEGPISVELAAGEVGEITLKSASLAVSYFGDAALDQEKFVDGWWRSGDLGYLDEEGLLFVKGRLDNRINSGGIKAHAEEIEAALLLHPDVQLAAVVGEPDQNWGERIEAYLVSRNPALTGREVSEYCVNNDLLPMHLLPKAVYFRDTLPTGPTGKLFRRGLKTAE